MQKTIRHWWKQLKMIPTDGEIIPCSWIGRINIVKMTLLPKAIYRFNALPIQLFHRTRRKNFTVCVETQKTLNSQSNLEKEKWNWRNQASWLQTILQSYSNQDSMALAQKRNIGQWNRIESPEINPHTYGHLIFDKGGENIQWRKESLFNEWCWENWTATCKRMNLEHFLTAYTKINSKWIKGLNMRPDTIKLLEENICRILYDVNHSRIFFDTPPRLMEIKAKINK